MIPHSQCMSIDDAAADDDNDAGGVPLYGWSVSSRLHHQRWDVISWRLAGNVSGWHVMRRLQPDITWHVTLRLRHSEQHSTTLMPNFTCQICLKPMTDVWENWLIFSPKLEPSSSAKFIAVKIGRFYHSRVILKWADILSSDFISHFCRSSQL